MKRGQAKVKNKIIPLTDDTVIEEHLGKFGVICLKDFIHEICLPGEEFQGSCVLFISQRPITLLIIEWASSRTWAYLAIEVNASISTSSSQTKPGSSESTMHWTYVFCIWELLSSIFKDYFSAISSEIERERSGKR